MPLERRPISSTSSSNLGDILSRVLDAGVVIAGDIKIKIVDIELLSIQIRLVVASVDRARELGLDWWRCNPEFCPRARRRRKRVRATQPKALLAPTKATLAPNKPVPA